MREFRKNLIVGFFVLVGLLAFGTMIIIFGMAPSALIPSYKVTMDFPSTGPIQGDDPIFLNGIQIGHVDSVEPLEDLRMGVMIICMIHDKYRIPADAQPMIRQQTFALGKPAITMNVGPENTAELLPTDGSARLAGEVLAGISELIPKETMQDLKEAGQSLTSLAKALKPVAEDLHELFKLKSVAEIDAAPERDRPLANLSTVVQRFDSSLKNFNRIMGDPENQRNLAVIVKNFRIVSERGIELSDRLVGLTKRLDTLTVNADDTLGKVSRAVTDNAEKLSTVLDQLARAGEALNSKKGSAGMLLNDPELYQALVLTARRLQLTVDELHKLIITWQEKGIKIEGGVLGK